MPSLTQRTPIHRPSNSLVLVSLWRKMNDSYDGKCRLYYDSVERHSECWTYLLPQIGSRKAFVACSRPQCSGRPRYDCDHASKEAYCEGDHEKYGYDSTPCCLIVQLDQGESTRCIQNLINVLDDEHASACKRKNWHSISARSIVAEGLKHYLLPVRLLLGRSESC